MKAFRIFIATLFLLLSISCQKKEIVFPPEKIAAICWDCDYLQQTYAGTDDQPTILGADIRNPYTLPVMQQAYRNVYHRDPGTPLKVTHYYVRFSPP
jgi:hypothetical protein